MSAPAFTPGPWEVHLGNGIVRKCEGDICQVIADMRAPYKHGVGIVKGEQQQWANARLIAAAPELYEALVEVRKIIAEGAVEGFQPLVGDWAGRLFDSQQRTSRALAKARGDAK